MASRIKEVQELQQVSTIATVTSMAIRGGSGVVAALQLSTRNASGPIADQVKLAVRAIELGVQPSLALVGKGALEEFYSKLLSAEQLGSSVAEQLDDLVESQMHEASNLQLRSASANETKMLIPLVFLILPVTVVFALYPSIQMLNQTL